MSCGIIFVVCLNLHTGFHDDMESYDGGFDVKQHLSRFVEDILGESLDMVCIVLQ